MAERLVGLIGPGRGPQVPTFRRRSVVRVAGLREGGIVNVYHDETKTVVGSNGTHPIPTSSFVQFEHEGDSRFLLCEVLRADAIPTD